MVGNTLVMRFTSGFALWFFLATTLSAIMPSVLLAQQTDSPDFEPPIIEHSVTQAGIVGGVEVFGATVVDNVEVGDVSLFYRFTGETEYAELQMREIASSSYYSAKVDTANVPLATDTIEYYIQARDTSGNIVLKGFAFQPLIKAFDVVPAAQATDATASSTTAAAKKVNWVYVALGVLVVGGVVAASGGGDEERCVGGCDVTVRLEMPQ